MNKWMIWGETPLFLETPTCCVWKWTPLAKVKKRSPGVQRFPARLPGSSTQTDKGCGPDDVIRSDRFDRFDRYTCTCVHPEGY